METNEIIEYMNKRIAVFRAHAAVMELKQIAEPNASRQYAIKRAMSGASILALQHTIYYIENGVDHPDLLPPVPSTEPEVAVVEEVEEKPAPKPARGRKPAVKPAARSGK